MTAATTTENPLTSETPLTLLYPDWSRSSQRPDAFSSEYPMARTIGDHTRNQ